MIAHKPAKRKDGQSNIKQLVDYITRKGHDPDVKVTITNCSYNNVALAVKEIESTQRKNTRSKKDKTYHLVISFPEGERPSNAVLNDIEKNICKSLDMEKHQRISALHNDTKCLHLHIAINQVSPDRYNNIQIKSDYKRLNDCCAEMEVKHGLIPVVSDENRLVNKHNNVIKSKKGIQLFKEWIDENRMFITGALNKENWESVNSELAKIDLVIRKRGNGFVLSAKSEKAFEKISVLGKAYSKTKLEDRLGKFDSKAGLDKKSDIKLTAQYKAIPQGNNELWKCYKEKYNVDFEFKIKALDKIKRDKKDKLDALNENYKNLRHKMKQDTQKNRFEKAAYYQGLFQAKKKEQKNIRQVSAQEKKAVYQQYKKVSWKDYLLDKAIAGDHKALDALRKMQVTAIKHGHDSLQGQANHELAIHKAGKIDKYGRVSYTSKQGVLIDTGKRLDVSLKTKSPDTLLAAIKMARQRFGDVLEVSGSDAFKKAIVEVAAKNNLAIQFSDKSLNTVFEALKTSQLDTGQSSDDRVNDWIDQRNKTKAKGADMKAHRLFNKKTDTGLLNYQGTRKLLDNVRVALFAKGHEMLVLKTQQDLSRFKVGTKMNLLASGVLTPKRKGLER